MIAAQEESCSVNKLSALRERFWRASHVVRLRPFDVSTPQGRSDERYRRIALTTLTSVAAKCAGVLSFLISVPLTIHYLGAERYGMWMAISSLVWMLASADFGIGYGLMNMMSESYGKEDWDAAARYVSSGFYSLLTVASLILACAFLVYPHVQWQRWFNVASPVAVHEAGPTLLVLIVCIAAIIPLSVTQKVQSGFQQGYIANLWAILGSCMGLIGVLVCIWGRVGLPWLVLAVAGAPALAALFNTGYTFLFQMSWLRPRLSLVRSQSTKRLLGLGLLFFVFQLAQVVGFQSDNMVLAHILGASKVPVYAVTSRMFYVVGMLMGFVIAPLWPAYGEAFARGDIAWLKRTLSRSIVLMLAICIPANIGLVLAGKWLLRLWVGPQIAPSYTLLLGIGLSQTLMAMVSPLSAFLNGLNVLGKQAIFASLMAVTNISTSIYLTRRIGVPGVIYGSVIAESLFFLLPFALLVRHTLRNLPNMLQGAAPLAATIANE
jgi:O-antigen/teichoic acid export membrane protein